VSTTYQPIFIAGPTAVGKTSLSLELAQRLNGEIISVDSMQVYRGLNIGTAKPSTDERERIPHHLIDNIELDQTFDAQQFVQQATITKQGIQERSKTPIFCGGTGLYFKALINGLDSLPPSDEALRKELEQIPLPELLLELSKLDPEWFEKIDQKNPRRVVRAIEIIRLTGKPVSTQRTTWKEKQPDSKQPLIVLSRSPETLRHRIESRVDKMFADGLVNETQALLEIGLKENETANRALGYRQVIEFLANIRSLDDTIALVKTKTWQFARRQLTWFRKQDNTQWIDLDQVSHNQQCEAILKTIAQAN
jgi:tRNA dimethylallyltransferase